MHKWLGLAAVVLIADQITKYVVSRSLALYESVEVTPFFNLVLVHNKGAAFSFLSDAGGWQRTFFTVIALVASVWITWLIRKHPGETVFCLALSLILGGALGNVIDRILFGAVIDFLDFHAYGYHWPLHVFGAFDQIHAALALTHRAFDFGVALVADHHDLARL